MNKISCIVWSFMFLITLAGCGAHQQLAGQKPQPAFESEKSDAPDQPVADDETASGSSSEQKDGTGFRVRPVEIEIKEGRPYLPVGADFVTKDGKVSLGEVIKALADQKGFSVSWADDVDQQRPVDCYIMAADNFYDALDNILRQLDYFYEIKEDTIVVKYKETNRYHLAMPNFNDEFKTSLGGDMLGQESADATGMAASATLKGESKINFWDDLDKILKDIIKCDGCPAPSIDRNLGIITVRAPRRIQNEVKEYLDQLEFEASKQVIVEAKIIEVALSKEHQTGIDWENVFGGTSGLGVTAGVTPSGYVWSKDWGFDRFLNTIALDDTTWNVAVHAFETYGDIRIVSNPKVHILNGRSALLNVTKNMEYVSKVEVTASAESSLVTTSVTTSNISEGLSMAVKVNILNDDEVMLYIFPTVARLVGDFENYQFGADSSVQLATTAVRQMSTYAKVKNNQFLVIGGLIDKTNGTTTKKIPILGDIPYLGKFFSYELIDDSSTELVILLKPRILKNNSAVSLLH